jgi:hypothetical protein
MLAICRFGNPGIFHGRTMGILTVSPLPSPRSEETDICVMRLSSLWSQAGLGAL